jgi:hypothetical protein
MKQQTFISTTVIGIVCGKVVGIAHSIMTEVGVFIAVFHLGTGEYTQIGERIIERVCGVDILGDIIEYLTANLEITGEVGTTAGIGKITIIGVLKECTIMVEDT